MPLDQTREMDKLVKKIWKKQIKEDYDKCRVFEESALRSAFYHHLREAMRDKKTLKDLVLYPEMRVRSPRGKNLRIDLAVVEQEECDRDSKGCEEKWKESGSCIAKLVAAFEFKHWDKFKWDQGYGKDVQKDLMKIKKYSEGVYFHDDKSKGRPKLKADLTYLCILLEKGCNEERGDILRRRGACSDVRLLLGENSGERLVFRYMGPPGHGY